MNMTVFGFVPPPGHLPFKVGAKLKIKPWSFQVCSTTFHRTSNPAEEHTLRPLD
jgi:hypothetical protein